LLGFGVMKYFDKGTSAANHWYLNIIELQKPYHHMIACPEKNLTGIHIYTAVYNPFIFIPIYVLSSNNNKPTNIRLDTGFY